MYFKHDLWLLGGTTALFALFPLLVTAFLLYSHDLHWISAVRLSVVTSDNASYQVLGGIQWISDSVRNSDQSSVQHHPRLLRVLLTGHSQVRQGVSLPQSGPTQGAPCQTLSLQSHAILPP